jgi:WD40 repeat protein
MTIGGARSVAYSPDGNRLAFGSGRANAPADVKGYDPQTGQELLAIKHADVRSVAYSPDGKRLAASSVSSDPSHFFRMFLLPRRGIYFAEFDKIRVGIENHNTGSGFAGDLFEKPTQHE